MIISYLEIEREMLKKLKNEVIDSFGLEQTAQSLQQLWDHVYQDVGQNEALAANKFREYLYVIRSYIDDLIQLDENDQ